MPLLTLPDAGSQPLSVRAKALVFEDPRSAALLARIRQLAPSHATVLISGETGTGKELVARHIHALSRPERPFLAVNCGALSESLLESELFGHEKGAFTGAISAKAGWFESAHRGTLFLDEIGDLSLGAQVKLLRVLQENEVVRLGSRQVTHVDVRLVAATNVKLEDAVAAGHFREDLFYRLNVAALTLLPLRERPGDILPLAYHFLEVYRQRLGGALMTFTADAERRLLEHAWPGNIRELENVMHHALLVCQGDRITPSDLRLSTLLPRASGSAPPPAPAPAPVRATLEGALRELFDQNQANVFEVVERALIQQAYRYCDQNQLQTARLLGISRNVVRARLIQYGEIQGSLRGSSPPPPVANSEPVTSLPRAEPKRAAPPEALRIGFQRLGLLPLLKARGTFDLALAERGVRAEWLEYPGGIQVVEALEPAALSFGVLGEGPPIFAEVSHAPIVYLAAEAPAPEGEGILVPGGSNIDDVSQLARKTVALHRGSNAHYLLIRALEEANLHYEDVNVRFMAPEAARRAFERNELDAWVIWDPVLAEMQHARGARLIRDARGLATNSVYHIASRAFAEARPELVELFLDELSATAKWALSSSSEEVGELAPKLGLSKAALHTALRRSASSRLLDAELEASQQRVADAFFKLRLISRPITMSNGRWSEALQGGQRFGRRRAAAAPSASSSTRVE
jgi:aliphatic sulfonates family ABC transporter substrate-binding protein